MPSPDITVYQIYYDEQTRARLDPAFTPLDNSANLRPDWFEYWPIRQALLGASRPDGAWLGFLSTSFFDKTRLTGASVLDRVRRSDADVISFSPFFDHGAIFLNPFEQGDRYHPGFMAASRHALRQLGVPLDLDALVCDSGTTIFSNYFIARARVWKDWLALGEQLFQFCENGTGTLRDELVSPTRYRTKKPVATKVFLMERLITVLLEQTGRSAELGIDVATAPLSRHFTDRHRSQLIACDALKAQYRRTRDPQYLAEYREQRAPLLRRLARWYDVRRYIG